MQYLEVLFDISYLIAVFVFGLLLFKSSSKQKKTFGVMAFILGVGDTFHLVPRIIGHLTTGLDDYVFYLGMGSMITSVTMTVFYFLLYRDYEETFDHKNRVNQVVIYGLLAVKLIITFSPQNNWFTMDASYLFSIVRNVPFILMGAYLVTLIFINAYKENNALYKKIGYGVTASFLFYMPVIFFVDFVPALGALMMPKTVAYLYVIYSVFKSKDERVEG